MMISADTAESGAEERHPFGRTVAEQSRRTFHDHDANAPTHGPISCQKRLKGHRLYGAVQFHLLRRPTLSMSAAMRQ